MPFNRSNRNTENPIQPFLWRAHSFGRNSREICKFLVTLVSFLFVGWLCYNLIPKIKKIRRYILCAVVDQNKCKRSYNNLFNFGLSVSVVINFVHSIIYLHLYALHRTRPHTRVMILPWKRTYIGPMQWLYWLMTTSPECSDVCVHTFGHVLQSYPQENKTCFSFFLLLSFSSCLLHIFRFSIRFVSICIQNTCNKLTRRAEQFIDLLYINLKM